MALESGRNVVALLILGSIRLFMGVVAGSARQFVPALFQSLHPARSAAIHPLGLAFLMGKAFELDRADTSDSLVNRFCPSP